MALPSAKRVTARARTDLAFRKRALADPGLRSRITDLSLLPADVRQQRQLNLRLGAPVTPGSSITERDLAREAKAATEVKYGASERQAAQNLAAAQQTQRDVGGFWDQYLARLGQNQRDIENINRGVQSGLTAVGQGITGLGASAAQGLQSEADKAAAARGTTAGDLGDLANKAAMARQALLGSFQAQQQLVGATQQGYASGLANVAGPAQKLQALAQEGQNIGRAREAITGLATEKGQADYLYRQQAREAEAKNVLAREIATGKEAATTAALRETVRSHKASEKLTGKRIEADATQAAATAAAKTAAAAQKASEPNQYGVPKDQWAGWSTSHRTRWIRDFKAKTSTAGGPAASKQEADAFYAKYGVKPLGTIQHNNAKDAVGRASNYIRQVRASNPDMPLAQIGQLLTRGQAGSTKKGQESIAIPKQNALFVRAAMDLAQGGLTNATAARLHRSGYIVRLLGLKRAKTPPTAANTQAYSGYQGIPQPGGR